MPHARAWLLVLAMLVPGGAELAARQPAASSSHRLLDVPYVTQTPELCGGAAVAMVLRYWGERDVFPEDFAALVVASEAGIPTGSLASAVRDRRWQAFEIPPGAETSRTRIRTEVDQGRPLMALIEVAPRTYHYVVIVGATDLEIVVHDPARAPFQVLRWDEFDRAWAAAGHWVLLILPPDGDRPRTPPPDTREPVDSPPSAMSLTPCDALVERGVTMATEGDRDGAEQALTAATRMCPGNPAAWRELSGWRFSQSRWAEAETLAALALQLAPGDDYSQRLLATSRYLAGDERSALEAWAPLGEPRIDAIEIHGALRTRHPVVVRATGLMPRQILTAEDYGRAVRRLGGLPAMSGARLRYTPIDGGLAQVDAYVAERPTVPRGLVLLASLAGHAAINHELRFEVAGALGAGERTDVSWRWSARRPRTTFQFAAPAPSRLPGVITLSALWEQQTYVGAVESRRRTQLALSDWGASWLLWEAGVALDRFAHRSYAAANVNLDVRLADDHVAIRTSVANWTPLGGGDGFGRISSRVAWRSTTEQGGAGWMTAATFTHASHTAPRALWEGAGTGNARSGLLRAHPLLRDDVLIADVFGRGVAYGTIEYSQPLVRILTAGLGFAGFVDAARAWRRTDGRGTSPLYVDVGVGLRLSAPGRPDTLRIDLAHGLRGGGARASVAWTTAWPK